MSDNGHDDAFGFGVRVGYMGKITPTITIGAAYSSKIDFDEFSKYAGLFAEQGDFDLPENYNLGVAWQATPQMKLALDYQRINYADVASVGNPVTNLLVLNQPLGSANGPGFGYANIDIWKLGMEYKYSPKMTLRAGYSHNDNPISGSDMGEVLLNILAPAVIENHATLGFTYILASGNEVTMSYMHGFENDVSAARPGAPFGTNVDTIKMYQNSLGIQYSWKM
jgi:long-chain fatty acid transport protein